MIKLSVYASGWIESVSLDLWPVSLIERKEIKNDNVRQE